MSNSKFNLFLKSYSFNLYDSTTLVEFFRRHRHSLYKSINLSIQCSTARIGINAFYQKTQHSPSGNAALSLIIINKG